MAGEHHRGRIVGRLPRSRNATLPRKSRHSPVCGRRLQDYERERKFLHTKNQAWAKTRLLIPMRSDGPQRQGDDPMSSNLIRVSSQSRVNPGRSAAAAAVPALGIARLAHAAGSDVIRIGMIGCVTL